MAASDAPIVTNQVKYHPYHRPDDLVAYCIENGILLTAYSPLAEGAVVGDERLAAIGEPHGKSAVQVTLRWLLQQPFVAAIPKASSRRHVEANADVFDFELTDEQLRAVFDLGGGPSDRLAAALGLD
jgi:diketogulonate reductase-like aldo/keto reductase